MSAERPIRPIRQVLKKLLPEDARHLPILRGPLRGGTFFAYPRTSLRKVFGLYEAELNPWLARALANCDLVIDVGANDGYFSFGSVAAMRRAGRTPRILSFEPQADVVAQLEESRNRQKLGDSMRVVQAMVGVGQDVGTVALDEFFDEYGNSVAPLIKIDVEGAEIDVLEGARKWRRPGTMFMIEVHKREYLETIPRILGVEHIDQISQAPAAFLGRELRDVDNWWIVSRLK